LAVLSHGGADQRPDRERGGAGCRRRGRAMSSGRPVRVCAFRACPAQRLFVHAEMPARPGRPSRGRDRYWECQSQTGFEITPDGRRVTSRRMTVPSMIGSFRCGCPGRAPGQTRCPGRPAASVRPLSGGSRLAACAGRSPSRLWRRSTTSGLTSWSRARASHHTAVRGFARVRTCEVGGRQRPGSHLTMSRDHETGGAVGRVL
jgi:hypothetical protein